MQEVNPLDGLREAITEAVRVEMARRRMTQQALAAAAGLKQQYISRRMTSEVPFTVDDLARIATVFDVPLSALLPVESKAA